MARAILFDFDGTLAPNLDLPDMRRQVLDITEDFKVPREIYNDRYIVEVIDAATDWLREHQGNTAARDYHEQAHRRIVDIEMTAAQSTEPFAQTRPLLRALQQAGLKLGVVTRNCRPAVLQVFPDLLAHVHVLLARDDTEFLKPDTRHLSACLQTLDCKPRQAVMVGDGRLDMQAGRALDMLCIGVLTGSGDRQGLLQAGAHHVLPDLNATSLQAHLDSAG